MFYLHILPTQYIPAFPATYVIEKGFSIECAYGSILNCNKWSNFHTTASNPAQNITWETMVLIFSTLAVRSLPWTVFSTCFPPLPSLVYNYLQNLVYLFIYLPCPSLILFLYEMTSDLMYPISKQIYFKHARRM